MVRKSGVQRHRRQSRSMLRRIGALGAAIVMFCTGLLVVAQPAWAGCGTVSIVNAYTGLAVSAELGDVGIFNGMLRARATSVGPWEKFTMCMDDNHVFTLKSQANNLYVSTEEDYEGGYQYLLRARAAVVGGWELFVMYGVGGDTVEFTGSPGYWVTSELGYSGSDQYLLRANRKSLGGWETWVFYPA
jgi:hypothetical protein